MPREGHGSRNDKETAIAQGEAASCPARGMGVEIYMTGLKAKRNIVMPREGHGSRNRQFF